MTCLIKGCNFVLKNIPQEAFVYQKDADPEFRFQTNHPHIFPYLLVNIGSGVSIVKVSWAPWLRRCCTRLSCTRRVSVPGQGTQTGK